MPLVYVLFSVKIIAFMMWIQVPVAAIHYCMLLGVLPWLFACTVIWQMTSSFLVACVGKLLSRWVGWSSHLSCDLRQLSIRVTRGRNMEHKCNLSKCLCFAFVDWVLSNHRIATFKISSEVVLTLEGSCDCIADLLPVTSAHATCTWLYHSSADFFGILSKQDPRWLALCIASPWFLRRIPNLLLAYYVFSLGEFPKVCPLSLLHPNHPSTPSLVGIGVHLVWLLAVKGVRYYFCNYGVPLLSVFACTHY